MKKYPIVPGRMQATREGMQQRLDFLKKEGYETAAIARTYIQPEQVGNNIESCIGSVEIPLGLAGPILADFSGQQEWIYAVAGTLEGALLASMNRGAKAVSCSGGFKAAVVHACQ